MRRTAGRAALIFLLACAPYLSSLGNGFHYDDFHSIVDNPHIRSLANLPEFFTDARSFSVHPDNAMYRPVLLVSYALNYAWAGMEPLGFHLVNVGLHGLNAVLVFLLVLALRQEPMVALSAALLFGVHPLNAESVNYVSSRSELLMAGFFLLACLAYLRFGRRGGWPWYALALVGGLLALLTKSVAVVLVGVLALCDWFTHGRRGWALRWRFYVPFVAMDLAYLLLTRPLVGKALLAPVRPLAVQAWTQIKAAVYYLLLAAMPVRLSVEHQFFPAPGFWTAPVVVALLLGASLVALVLWRGSRTLRFAAVWGVAALLPAAAVPLIVLVNEHRLYLAGVGASLLLARWLHSILGRRRGVALGILAVYTLALAQISLERSRVWASELSLWQDAAAKAPLMVKPHLRMGDALSERGRPEAAEAAYRRAVALRPEHPGARNNLGRLYLGRGRLAQAEEQFRGLLRVSPDMVAARLNLARLLLQRGDWQEAAAECRRVMDFDDPYATSVARGRLGQIALHYQADPELALEHYDAALALASEPGADLLLGRGVALKALRRSAEAETAYREALRLQPDFADAWYNLGNLYVAAGRLGEAAAAYAEVVKLDADEHLKSLAIEQLQSLRP